MIRISVILKSAVTIQVCVNSLSRSCKTSTRVCVCEVQFFFLDIHKIIDQLLAI
jgi:hypothetical protein